MWNSQNIKENIIDNAVNHKHYLGQMSGSMTRDESYEVIQKGL